jgi:hypothetical protein
MLEFSKKKFSKNKLCEGPKESFKRFNMESLKLFNYLIDIYVEAALLLLWYFT